MQMRKSLGKARGFAPGPHWGLRPQTPVYLVAALLFGISAARGADTPAPTDPARLLEAQKAFDAAGGSAAFNPYFNALSTSVSRYLSKWSGQPEDKVKGAVDKILMPDIKATNDIARQEVQVFADSFSVAELQQIEAFESSAIGQRWKSVRSGVEKKIYDAQLDWWKKIWPEVFKRHQKELADLGIKKQESVK